MPLRHFKTKYFSRFICPLPTLPPCPSTLPVTSPKSPFCFLVTCVLRPLPSISLYPLLSNALGVLLYTHLDMRACM